MEHQPTAYFRQGHHVNIPTTTTTTISNNNTTQQPTNLFSEATAVAALGFLEATAAARSGRPAAGAGVAAGEALTYFHSLVLPDIALSVMARALVQSRIAVDWTTIAIAAAIFARFDAVAPVTAHMTHRLLATCVAVAAKAHQDAMPSNGLVGRTVGMTGRELTLLEFKLAAALDWRFIVDAADADWRGLLCRAGALARPAAAPMRRAPVFIDAAAGVCNTSSTFSDAAWVPGSPAPSANPSLDDAPSPAGSAFAVEVAASSSCIRA
jgi:hypothetical protein